MDEQDDIIAKMIEDAFKEAGVDMESKCDFMSDPELADVRLTMRSNLIREMVTSGTEKMMRLIGLACASRDLHYLMSNGGLTVDDHDRVMHGYSHVAADVYNEFVEHAMAPYVRRVKANGRYKSAIDGEDDLVPPPVDEAALVESLCRIQDETFRSEVTERGWGGHAGGPAWNALPEPVKEARRAAMRAVLKAKETM